MEVMALVQESFVVRDPTIFQSEITAGFSTGEVVFATQGIRLRAHKVRRQVWGLQGGGG